MMLHFLSVCNNCTCLFYVQPVIQRMLKNLNKENMKYNKITAGNNYFLKQLTSSKLMIIINS